MISTYKCYVDNIICMFANEKDAENFLEFLNSQHKKIKSTLEIESNKSFSFLDILIKNKENRFPTSAF